MKNFKIALVDDDPMILTMLKLRLQDLSNVEVNTFNSGEDFLNGINWYLDLSESEITKVNNYSREFILKKFSEKEILNKYLKIYNKII